MTEDKRTVLETLTAAGEALMEVEMAMANLTDSHGRVRALTKAATWLVEDMYREEEVAPDLAEAIAYGFRFINKKALLEWHSQLQALSALNSELVRVAGEQEKALGDYARAERLRNAEPHDNPIAQLFEQLGR